MDFLEALKSILNRKDWKEAYSLPGWRSRPPRAKKNRTPFRSTRRRGPGAQHMQVEAFTDKDRRDERFRELRSEKTPHLSKFSTYEGNHSLWCVVYR